MESDSTPKDECYEIEIPFPLFQYLSLDNCDIQSLCRICLSEKNNQLFPLINYSDSGVLSDMFTSITSLQVHKDDGLPSHICDACKMHVINCYEFKVKCIKSDSVLKSLLNGEFNAKDEPTDKNIKLLEPLKEVNKEIFDVKKEEIVEDVQYLEDFGESDNEALCIMQNNEEYLESNKEKVLLSPKKNKEKEKKPKPRVCTFCSKKFRNTKAVKEHIKRMHQQSHLPNSCGQCKESYQSDHDLKLHLPVHGPGPLWKCVECSKEFKGRSMFRRHIQRHMNVKRYSCAVCDKPFAELYALRRHSRVHTGEHVEKHHICHICSKRYSESGLLARHIARHSDSRPCVCDLCGKAFPSARLLASHHLVHSDNKPHKCKYCDKRFRHESTRNTHHRTHTGEKPYVCATCGKRFIQNSNLTLHMRTHTGERPYSCDKCDRSFSSGSTLKSHVRTHTGDKPYSCHVCGKKFARVSLRAHMRQHTGERPFACSVCARSFVTAARLRDHSRIHTGEKPFECSYCFQKFSNKSQLVKHVKFHQKEQKKLHVSSRRNEIDRLYDDATVESFKNGDTGSVDDVIVNVDVTDTESKDEVEVTQVDDVTEEVILPELTNQEENIHEEPLCLTSGVNSDMYTPSDMNLMTVGDVIGDGEVRIAANALDGNVPVKLYQVDHSLVQISSSRGQVTISKYTSKLTTNF